MNKLIGSLVIFLIAGTSQIFATEGVYSVGDTGPAGGLIFYVDSVSPKLLPEGITYLEAAPADYEKKLSEYKTLTSFPWSNGKNLSTSATGKAVGTGKDNTAKIINVQGPGKTEKSYAAEICDNLELGGHSDWFLPSIGELTKMYTNLHINLKLPVEKRGGFVGQGYYYYWSSTEKEGNEWVAFNRAFSQNTEDTSSKNFEHKVRCARAF